MFYKIFQRYVNCFRYETFFVVLRFLPNFETLFYSLSTFYTILRLSFLFGMFDYCNYWQISKLLITFVPETIICNTFSSCCGKNYLKIKRKKEIYRNCECGSSKVTLMMSWVRSLSFFLSRLP